MSKPPEFVGDDGFEKVEEDEEGTKEETGTKEEKE